MGVNESAICHGYIGENDVDIFVQKSHFTKKQIYILAAKYREISHDSKISLEDFQKAFCIESKKIAAIMYRIIDKDQSGSISFPELVDGLNKIHPDSPFEDKVKVCFDAYDADGGQTVSKDEIESIVKISLENNPYIEFSEAQIIDLVDNLIKKYDKTGNGELSYQEFYNMISNAPGVIEAFNLDINKVFDIKQ